MNRNLSKKMSGLGNMKWPVLFVGFLIGVFFLTTGCSIGVRHKEEPKKILPPDSSNAWVNLEFFLSHRRPPVPVKELKFQCLSLLTNGSVKGQYSIYFEDLKSGARFGINATNRYNQWSLLKVPVAATVLKKVERGELGLRESAELTPAELDTATLFPELNHAGDKLTVRELLKRLIRYSDNAASFALSRFFSADEFQSTLLSLGALPASADKPRNFLPPISPEEYANVLRNLYFAGYLSKSSSELMLAMMASTVYDSQIVMDLPPDIKVAHKVGFNAGSGEFHDCGIVYLPDTSYILCVMSKNSTREEADRMISEISRLIYEYLVRYS